MNAILQLLKDYRILLIFIGTIFLLLGILGRISTKWGNIPALKISQRVSLIIIGTIIFVNVFASPFLLSDKSDRSIKSLAIKMLDVLIVEGETFIENKQSPPFDLESWRARCINVLELTDRITLGKFKDKFLKEMNYPQSKVWLTNDSVQNGLIILRLVRGIL